MGESKPQIKWRKYLCTASTEGLKIWIVIILETANKQGKIMPKTEEDVVNKALHQLGAGEINNTREEALAHTQPVYSFSYSS